MKHKNNRVYPVILIFALFSIIFGRAVVYSGTKSSDNYLENSVSAFLEDDYESAIKSLEIALSFEPKNRKISVFITKILIEGSLYHFSVGEDKTALLYAKRAAEINYRNRKVGRILGYINPEGKSKRKSGEETLPLRENIAKGQEEEETQEGKYRSYEKLLLLVKSLEKEQSRKIRSDDKSTRQFQKIIKKSDARKQETLKALQKNAMKPRKKARRKTEKREKKYVVRSVINVFIAIVVAALFIVITALAFRLIGKKRREVTGRKEAILKEAFPESKVLVKGKARLKTGKMVFGDATITLGDMLYNENPFFRSAGIKILEGRVKDRLPAIMKSILKTLLKDSNNRVRANAARAIYRHSSRKSLKVINRMAKSIDIKMRISAACILGEMECAQGIDILQVLLKDGGRPVMKGSLESLKKIEKSEQVVLKDSDRIMLSKLISKYDKYKYSMKKLRAGVRMKEEAREDSKYMPSKTRELLSRIRDVREDMEDPEV